MFFKKDKFLHRLVLFGLLFGAFNTLQAQTYGKNGMVVSDHYLSSEVE